MKLKTYKVYTKWIGYSEIEIQARSKEEVKELVAIGNYDPNDEIYTGYGLEYGYDEEEITKIEEQESDNDIK
jgi:hypothetical protein